MAATYSSLLQENGSYLLQEDGTYFILEPQTANTSQPTMALIPVTLPSYSDQEHTLTVLITATSQILLFRHLSDSNLVALQAAFPASENAAVSPDTAIQSQ